MSAYDPFSSVQANQCAHTHTKHLLKIPLGTGSGRTRTIIPLHRGRIWITSSVVVNDGGAEPLRGRSVSLSLACIPFTVEGSADRFSEGPVNGLMSSGKTTLPLYNTAS